MQCKNHTGQGANSAIQDAGVLAEALDNADSLGDVKKISGN
ncbi:hypothetical protein [Halalkalibacter krulwichiae]|uniref:Uncharacterized protein n=1 Tax=Halalkalibacter krulwichiae TaxID=199441 RepID=A0A1X9M5Y1_9BACI|nr:hypothetical protein [Halalkalibacter krulwichiae]ARK28855.1 hypothetical protein BkAM31D_02725 [Halalkalibacter krulwichiae]